MKKIIIFILFINIQCTPKINVTSLNKDLKIQYGKKSKKNPFTVIYFMDGFSENVIVKKNSSIELNEFIKTDKSISNAEIFHIKDIKNGDLIQLIFGKEEVRFNFNEKYPQVEIYNLQNHIKINFSKINSKNLE